LQAHIEAHRAQQQVWREALLADEVVGAFWKAHSGSVG
jgi:hypothetical protein